MSDVFHCSSDNADNEIATEIDGVTPTGDVVLTGNALNLQAGYLFKNNISLDARYTHLKADNNSFMNNATFYNRPNYYTIGLTKLAGRNYGFKVHISLRKRQNMGL